MPRTLLLADDSVTIQKVVGISFANEDIVLLTVDNGDDAIARAREARPDVVLADVVMPGKNGYDVCQAIKSDASLSHIPVLLLTGTFEAFDEQRAARVGADGHITKPFEAQALVDKVNALLARGSAADAAEPAAATGSAPGAPRAQRPAAPPPQPVSHTADTAYDFFDDEITAPRGAGETPAPETTVVLSAPAAPAPPDDGFSLDADEAAGEESATAPAASGFGSDELDLGSSSDEASLFDDFSAPAAAEGRAEPARSEAPAWEAPAGSGAFGWMDSAPARADAASAAEPASFGFEPEPARPAAPAPSPSSGSYGFEPEAAPAEASGFEPEPAPASAPAAFGFDGDPLPEPASPFDWEAGGSESEAPHGETPEWFAPSAPASDPGATRVGGLPAPSPSAPAAGAARGFGEFELEEGFGQSAAFGSAVADPAGAHDYDVSSSDLGPLLAASPPLAAASDAPRASAAESAPAASPGTASRALPERERRELHDALEKMAWEAFGPVAESLVREAVERIERIAWEVIPQLAESLIKEELRKLKGE